MVGRLLLAEAGCRLPVEHLVIAADSPPADCLRAGRALAAPLPRTATRSATGTGLLVMADGSARRTLKAPGYLDDRAAPFDAGVEECLASGRLAGLAELDPALAAELLVAGRAAWQVLAGAVGEAGRPRPAALQRRSVRGLVPGVQLAASSAELCKVRSLSARNRLSRCATMAHLE